MELRSVEAMAKALQAENIRYIVVGGLAVNAHGYERFTHDVDLVISLEPDNITRALHALIAIGYRPSIPGCRERKGFAGHQRAQENRFLPTMNRVSLDNHPGWQWCTAEGAELHSLLIGLKTTLAEKIQWLEEAENLTIALRAGRGKSRLADSYDSRPAE